MNAVHDAPNITPQDRLGLTLFIALAVHVIVILGVGFQFQLERQAPQLQQKLDITLVDTRSDQAPEEAEQLAQANQDGDGNVAERVRPQAPAMQPAPLAEPGDAAQTTPALPPPASLAPPRPQILARSAPEAPATTPPGLVRPATQPLSAAVPFERSRAVTGLEAATGEKLQVYARLPRKKQVTARTREYAYATYLDAWRRKVERIGNLNYPDEARRRHLSGTLMLQVDLDPDGSLREVILLRSSGQKLLDDAAIRIVHLAAPFAPFPKPIRAEVDILQIIRTWQFLTENRLSSQ